MWNSRNTHSGRSRKLGAFMVTANILLRWLTCARVAAAGIMLAGCGRAVAQDARTADAHIAPREDPSLSSLTQALRSREGISWPIPVGRIGNPSVKCGRITNPSYNQMSE